MSFDLETTLRRYGVAPGESWDERPWGGYLDWYRDESRATLKIMVVRPGARMSLQRHAHRDEVWRVLEGKGLDEGTKPATPLEPGTTHFVAVGATHRIANTGSEPLVIVEVQLGECREDDIERLEDDFGR